MAGGRKQSWLSRILDRGASRDDEGGEYELVVIDGADEGARFALDQPQIQIGRAAPGSPRDAGILLSDRSVSAKQALVSCEGGRVTLQHLPSATNPTLVNGRRIKQKRIRSGDRIALGFAVLELRAVKRPSRGPVGAEAYVPSRVATDPVNLLGELVVSEGPDEFLGRRFALDRAKTRIGRERGCEIELDIGAISRTHASLVWEGDQLILVHESSVNPTDVNGRRIRDRRRVFHGDEIRLSERVTFQVELEADTAQPEAQPARGDARTDSEAATRLTTPPSAAEAPTFIDAQVPRSPAAAPPPPSAAGRDSEATRIDPIPDADPTESHAPSVQGRARDESAATRIEKVPAHDPAADAPTRIEEAPGPNLDDAEATRISEVQEPPADDAAATRISTPPARDYGDGAATRIFQPPAASDESDYSEGDRTRIADAPVVPDYGEGERTRIADAPVIPDSSPAPAARDADNERTMIRPSPFAEPKPEEPQKPEEPAEREAPKTRVIDLDVTLREMTPQEPAPDPRDDEKTMIRPVPAQPASGDERTVVHPVPTPASPTGGRDPEATVIRPVPNFEPEATKVIEPDEPDDDPDKSKDDS